jgi:acyl-coenzyme A synthetase/AMP-(fatty) acid ligase
LTLAEFLKTGDNRPLEFEQLPVGQPLYILYSSGTSGKPKCIVHSAGVRIPSYLSGFTYFISTSLQGVLINTKKDVRMAYNASQDDTYFQYTTVSNTKASCDWAEIYSLLPDGLDDVDLHADGPGLWHSPNPL